MKHESELAGEAGGARKCSVAVLTLAVGLLVLGGYSAGAHPGHGLGDGGVAHAVTSPYHLTVLAGSALGLGLMLGLGARFARSPWARRALQAGAALALLTGAALWLA